MRVPACALSLLVLGCWPDFPDSRFSVDASAGDRSRSEQAVDQPKPGDGLPDGPRSDQPQAGDLRPDFSGSCTPGQFVGCLDAKTLQRCNSSGTGLDLVFCTPFGCNAVQGHCDECKVNLPPKCVIGGVETCTPEGLLKTTPCPEGCKAGVCCTDADGDTYTACAGDCNDNDKLVNPSQMTFSASPSAGSFDYNCDGYEEPEVSTLANCVKSGSTCTGAGWTGSIPACGQSGSFADCVSQGASCVQQLTTKPQACR